MLLAFIAVASCLDDENKAYELERFKRLKSHLYEVEYDVEAYFCQDGEYSAANLPNPKSQGKAHRRYTTSLIRMKEKFVRAGWDPTEFFCTGRQPGTFKRDELDQSTSRTKVSKFRVLQRLHDLFFEDD